MLTRRTFAICQTALFYLLFITMGSITSIPGPTLTSIEENLKGGGNLNLIFVFRPLGYIVGAALGGIILDKFVKMKEPVLCAESLAMGILILGIGFCDYSWKVYLVIFFVGIATQSLNAGVNVALLNLWGRKAASYFQALHFSFSVGALTASLIAKPFVEDTAPQKYPSKVVWAYAIVGCGAIFVTLVFFLFTLVTWKETKSYKTHCVASDLAVAASVPLPALPYTILSMTFILLSAFFELSIEISYSQCVATYASKGYLQLTKEQASYITAAFWTPYMVSRFIAIFVTNRIDIRIVIFESCLFLIIAGVVLVFSGYKQASGFWAGTILLGWGIGPLFPATIIWFSKYVEVTFMIGSLFFIVGAVAEMLVPQFLLANVNTQPRLLSIWTLTASIGVGIFDCLLWIVFFQIKDRYHRREPAEPSAPPTNSSDHSSEDRYSTAENETNLTNMSIEISNAQSNPFL